MFFKKKEKNIVIKPTIEIKKIEFPVCIELHDENDDIIYVYGNDVNKYFDSNIIESIVQDFEYSEIYKYSDVKDKINKMNLNILNNGLVNIDIELNTNLTDVEERYLLQDK